MTLREQPRSASSAVYTTPSGLAVSLSRVKMPSDPPYRGVEKGGTSDPPGGGSKKGRFWAPPGGVPGGVPGGPRGGPGAGGAPGRGGENLRNFLGGMPLL